MKRNGLATCLALLSASICAGVFAPQAMANDKKLPLFKISSLDAPFVLSQPVLPINLMGDEHKELVMLGKHNGVNVMSVYRFDTDTEQYQTLDQVIINERFIGYDVSKPDDERKTRQQYLYFLAADGVYRYHPKQGLNIGEIKPHQSVSSIYLQTKNQYLSKIDFIEDLNNDGVDDIALQDFTSMNIVLGEKIKPNSSSSPNLTKDIQSPLDEGTLNLPLTAEMRYEYGDMIYQPVEYLQTDVNFDGKDDLLISQNGKLSAFLQTESGSFEVTPVEISTRDDINAQNWWDVRGEDGQELDQSNLKYRRLEELVDVNGDNITDMVVRFTQSSGVLDRTNDYEVYYGKNSQGRLSFSPQADTVIKASGTLSGLEFIDVDNDNRKEVIVSAFDIGLSQIISALMSGSVDQEVHVFSLNEDNQYAEKSQFNKDVELSFSLSSGRSGQPIVLLNNFLGDDQHDLLLSGSNRLRMYEGHPKNSLFKSRSRTQKVPLPKDGSMVVSDDLNSDGKQDLVFRYSPQDDEEHQGKIRVLFAY